MLAHTCTDIARLQEHSSSPVSHTNTIKRIMCRCGESRVEDFPCGTHTCKYTAAPSWWVWAQVFRGENTGFGVFWRKGLRPNFCIKPSDLAERPVHQFSTFLCFYCVVEKSMLSGISQDGQEGHRAWEFMTCLLVFHWFLNSLINRLGLEHTRSHSWS